MQNHSRGQRRGCHNPTRTPSIHPRSKHSCQGHEQRMLNRTHAQYLHNLVIYLDIAISTPQPQINPPRVTLVSPSKFRQKTTNVVSEVMPNDMKCRQTTNQTTRDTSHLVTVISSSCTKLSHPPTKRTAFSQ